MGLLSWFLPEPPEWLVDGMNGAGRAAIKAGDQVIGHATTAYKNAAGAADAVYEAARPPTAYEKALADQQRRQGLPVRRVKKTPKERWQARQLSDYQRRVSELSADLESQIEGWQTSCYAPLFHRKVNIKQQKKQALDELKRLRDWDSLQEKARELLDGAGNVVAGWHSRTRDLLQEIVGTEYQAGASPTLR